MSDIFQNVHYYLKAKRSCNMSFKVKNASTASSNCCLPMNSTTRLHIRCKFMQKSRIFIFCPLQVFN